MSTVIRSILLSLFLAAALKTTDAAMAYSIGQPTDEEQQYVEYVNRARSNPIAEARRFQNAADLELTEAYQFFNVDLNLFVSQMSIFQPVPPLSISAQLTAAARFHAQDMFDNQYQGHVSGTSTIPSRIADAGYVASVAGENVYSYSLSVLQGYGGFEVDWGNGTNSVGGMQNPPGHRINNHSSLFREIGVGVVDGVNGPVGPQVVSEDFAAARTAQPFITGVAYYDLNGNHFYDLAEGIAGVTVTVNGIDYYAITANSGGYSVPVSQDGTYTVTFAGSGLAPVTQTVKITNQSNVKLDFMPAYAPPIITGPNIAAIGRSNTFQFSSVGAAIGYQWLRADLVPPSAEGAENGTNDIIAVLTPGYSLIVSDVKASGNNSFHLATPGNDPQYLTLNRSFLLGSSNKLEFNSRLGWASIAQIARAQISTNHGVAWQDVWTQLGIGDQGELLFRRKSISLSAFAGQEIMVRFVYDFADLNGSVFPQTSTGVGWYLDDITLIGAQELANISISDAPAGNSFSFVPAAIGTYNLQVRAKFPAHFLEWGPRKIVSAANIAIPVTVKINGTIINASKQSQIDFSLTSGTSSAFTLETAPFPTGPWRTDSTSSVQNLGNGTFRALGQIGAGTQAYYRVRVN